MVALAAMPVSASNPSHPRTPVEWSAQPCGIVHDRSLDGPVVRFHYDVPQEDVDGISDNEVEDARRHQFFAFCRGHAVRDLLPTWIDEADVAAAAAKGLPLTENVPPSEILDQSNTWSDCWWAITADEQRRPISFDAAAAAVEWDTSGLEPGAYVIEGYTWDPPYNLWTTRPGYLKVIDGEADRDAHPALGLAGTNQIAAPDAPISLRACSDVASDAVLSIDVAVLSPGQVPEWVEVATDLAAPGPEGSITFTPGEDFAEQAITVRVRSEDGQGRTAVAYLPAELSLTNASGEPPHGEVEPTPGDGGGCGVAPATRDVPLRLAPWIGLGCLLAAWATQRRSMQASRSPRR